MTTYRDNYPYNIEAPQKINIQYSHDINFDYSTGKYPDGTESDWHWENVFIPITHLINGLSVGRHEWMRIKVGEPNFWTYPIKISAKVTNIQSVAGAIQDDGVSFDFTIILTFEDGTTKESNPITIKNGKDGLTIVEAQIDGNGDLIILYSDGTTENAGRAKGDDAVGLPPAQNDDWILSQSAGVPVWIDPLQIYANVFSGTSPITYDFNTGIIGHLDTDGNKHIPVGGDPSQVLSTDGNGNYTWIDGGGSSSIDMQDTAPTPIVAASLWVDTTSMDTFAAYDDGVTTQYVQIAGNESGGGEKEVFNVYIVGSTPLASDWLSLTVGGAALTPEIEKIYIIKTAGIYLNTQYEWDGAAYVSIGGGGTGTDADAIHDNVAAEISALTAKTTLVDTDVDIIEDSETTPTAFGKKKVTWSTRKSQLKGYFDAIYAPISIVGDMVLSSIQSVTGLKTFDKDKIAMKGTSTGVNTISVANTSATDYTNILPAKAGTFAMTSDIVSGISPFDATVGSTGADYTSIQDALTALKYNLLLITDLAVSSNITGVYRITGQNLITGTKRKITFTNCINVTAGCYFENLEIWDSSTTSGKVILSGSITNNCIFVNNTSISMSLAGYGTFINSQIKSINGYGIFTNFTSGAIINCVVMAGSTGAGIVNMTVTSTATVLGLSSVTNGAYPMQISGVFNTNIHEDISIYVGGGFVNGAYTPSLRHGSTKNFIVNFLTNSLGAHSGTECNFVNGHFVQATTITAEKQNFTNVIFTAALTITGNSVTFVNCTFLSTISWTSSNSKMIGCRCTGAVTVASGSGTNIITGNTLTGGLTDNSGVSTNIIKDNV